MTKKRVAEMRAIRDRAEDAREKMRALYPIAVERLRKLVEHVEPAIALRACALVFDRVQGDVHVRLERNVPSQLDDILEEFDDDEALEDGA